MPYSVHSSLVYIFFKLYIIEFTYQAGIEVRSQILFPIDTLHDIFHNLFSLLIFYQFLHIVKNEVKVIFDLDIVHEGGGCCFLG